MFVISLLLFGRSVLYNSSPLSLSGLIHSYRKRTFARKTCVYVWVCGCGGGVWVCVCVCVCVCVRPP